MTNKSTVPQFRRSYFSTFPKHLVLLFVALFIGLMSGNALARSTQVIGKVRFSWDPNPESIVTGYRVHWGTEPGVYTNTLDVGNVTEVVIQDFYEGVTHYSAITAYSATGEESDYSDEIRFMWTTEAATSGPGSPGFQITTLEVSPAGQISIQFSGNSGLTSVDVQASSDLITWSSLGIATPVDGAIQIVDPQAAEHSCRYYRLDDQQ